MDAVLGICISMDISQSPYFVGFSMDSRLGHPRLPTTWISMDCTRFSRHVLG